MSEMTPNVKKLFIHRVSVEAVPSGGGLADGMEFFRNAEKRKRIMASSEQWVKQAIVAVRGAGEPNPWKHADDETIATEIMRRVAGGQERER